MADTLDLVDAACRVDTVDRLEPLLRKTLHALPIDGIDAYVANLNDAQRIIRNDRQAGINYPVAWTAAYREERFGEVDPIGRHLYASPAPLIWSDVRKRFSGRGYRAFFAAARAFGLRDGFAYGRQFATLSRASFFSCFGADLARHDRHLAVLHYVLPQLHYALERTYKPAATRNPALTPRELEVLTRARNGNTNRRIAVALNLGERTVKFHIENAIRKLDAVNRTHAVSRAMTLGLIPPT